MAAYSTPYARNLTIGNKTFQGNRTIDFDVSVPWGLSLAAALAATLTTRTDNDTGVLTVASGHGITTSDKVDFYWTDSSGVLFKRIGCTVTATGATTVTIDAGTGDNLPLVNSTGTVQIPVELDLPTIDGDDLKAIGFDPGQYGGTVVVVDDGPGETVLPTTGTDMVYVWDGTGTNPLAGKTITGVKASQAGTSAVTVFGAFALDT